MSREYYDANSPPGSCRASVILTGKFTACHRADGHFAHGNGAPWFPLSSGSFVDQFMMGNLFCEGMQNGAMAHGFILLAQMNPIFKNRATSTSKSC